MFASSYLQHICGDQKLCVTHPIISSLYISDTAKCEIYPTSKLSCSTKCISQVYEGNNTAFQLKKTREFCNDNRLV